MHLPRDFLTAVEKDADAIRQQDHLLDVQAYLRQWLPSRFPNKGLHELVSEGRTIEIHHEALELHALLAELASGHGFELESLIDHYGNTHQRDYCYIVLGHRFDTEQVVQFRGILGVNRLYKIVLMLLLGGCSVQHLRLVDHQPDYRELAHDDLRHVSQNLDLIVVGGLVVGGHDLDDRFAVESEFRGHIVSGRQCNVQGRKILLTTFPYGDLSFFAAVNLFDKIPKKLIFTGAAGAIAGDYKVGDIFLPEMVREISSSRQDVKPSHEAFTGLLDLCKKGIHASVKTPLVETNAKIHELCHLGITTIDVEVSHFHLACIDCLRPNVATGILLYVSDLIGQNGKLSPIEFSALRLGRQRVVETIFTLCSA
jgi:hypothetical protein